MIYEAAASAQDRKRRPFNGCDGSTTMQAMVPWITVRRMPGRPGNSTLETAVLFDVDRTDGDPCDPEPSAMCGIDRPCFSEADRSSCPPVSNIDASLQTTSVHPFRYNHDFTHRDLIGLRYLAELTSSVEHYQEGLVLILATDGTTENTTGSRVQPGQPPDRWTYPRP